MSDGYPILRLRIDFAETELPWTYPIALNGRTVVGIYVDGELHEPKRACGVKGSIYYDEELYGYSDIELTCGHSLYWFDDELPGYCPECGAKVVKA